MKRTERHHLKENPLAISVRQLQERWRTERRTLIQVLAAAVVLIVVVGGYFGWRQWQQSQAGERLAEALSVLDAPVVPAPAEPVEGSAPPAPPPEGSYPSLAAKLEAAVPGLLEVADTYPSRQAGILARFEAAAALAALGRTDEASQHYQRVIDAAGDGIYGQMARLGLADTHVRGGDYDRAIEVLEREAARGETDVPVDAVLMRLGETYRLAGKPAEARAVFNRIVEEFPTSPYQAAAEREAEALRQLERRAGA